MAKFSFRERSTEGEGLPEEEGTDVSDQEESGGRAGGLRRILIIAGIGVILIGGWYLAQPLFFAPPPPPGPARPGNPGASGEGSRSSRPDPRGGTGSSCPGEAAS